MKEIDKVPDLKTTVQQEMDKRAAMILSADPQWNRLRGMLDILENKVHLKEDVQEQEEHDSE